jgi:hypothetical protein
MFEVWVKKEKKKRKEKEEEALDFIYWSNYTGTTKNEIIQLPNKKGEKEKEKRENGEILSFTFI